VSGPAPATGDAAPQITGAEIDTQPKLACNDMDESAMLRRMQTLSDQITGFGAQLRKACETFVARDDLQQFAGKVDQVCTIESTITSATA
jgi:hypothetical protein